MKRELGLAAAVYAALAVAMTWPLVANVRSELPIGGDNRHLAWVLAWIARAIVRQPLDLFDGNIFHPAAKTIALSDPNVSSALLVAPAWWLTGDPALLVNLLFLGSFVLCGVAAQALARDWGASPLGGFAAGILFAFSPMRFSQIDHVQLYAFWWTPLALLALDRFLRTGSSSALAAGTLCLVLQTYASIYLAAFAAAAVVVVVAVALVTGRMRVEWRPTLAKGFVAFVAAMLLCVPLAIAYAEVRLTWGAARTLEQNMRYSASPLAYLSVLPGNVVWSRALEGFADPVAPWEKHRFPGLVSIVLAVIALARDRKSWMTRSGLALAIVGLVCSLGPRLVWRGESTGVPLPYLLAWQWLPPLQALRGPARWALVASLGLALTGAAGASRLPRALAGGLLVFAVLEAWVYPLPTTTVPSIRPSPLDEWLASSGSGAVIELPFASAEEEYAREPARVYRSAFHWRPIVNGYSGYAPPPYRAVREILAESPAAVLPVLAAWDVRTLVLHLDEMAPAERAAWAEMADREPLRRRFNAEGVVVLELDLPAAPATRVAARFAESPSLAAGETIATALAFDPTDLPIGLAPEVFGWHRGRARWTAADGADVEHPFNYFCPPAIYRGVPWRTAYVTAPPAAGRYRFRFAGECFDLDAAVTVTLAG